MLSLQARVATKQETVKKNYFQLAKMDILKRDWESPKIEMI